jgi:hypothetical protein
MRISLFHFIVTSHYLCPKSEYSMPEKIKPTASKKRLFFIHAIIFIIATIAMVMIHHEQGKEHWAYPWHAWIIAAWGLSLIGHGCAVFLSVEDKGSDEYYRQANNG